MIIGVMRLSYNERAVSEGRFRHHLFQAVFVRTSYPSRYMYFRWSRVHKAVETAVTATVVMWERCKSRVQLEASEIGEIQAPVAHERRLLWRPDLHQVKDLFLYFLKILTWWGDIPIRFGATVADLGFHEGGFVYGGARLRVRENFCKPRPLPAKNHALLGSWTIPQVLS